MDVDAGDLAVRGELQVDDHARAIRGSGGLDEGELLACDRVLEVLSDVRHFVSFRVISSVVMWRVSAHARPASSALRVICDRPEERPGCPTWGRRLMRGCRRARGETHRGGGPPFRSDAGLLRTHRRPMR